MKYAVYIQINKEANTDMVSISNLIAFFENYINDQGWELYKVYSDVSPASTLKREGLQNLMTDAKSNKFDAVVVQNLTRVARSAHLAQQVIDLLDANQIKLITLNDSTFGVYPKSINSLSDTHNIKEFDYNYLNQKCCAVYIRTQLGLAENEKFVSNQIQQLKQLAKDYNFKIYNIYSDLGSGSTLEREGIQNLMSDAINTKFDVILVKELSRISRNGVIIKQFINFLNVKEIELVTFDRGLTHVTDNIFAQSATSNNTEDV